MRGRLNGVAKRRVLGNEKMSLAEARLLRNEEKKALKAGIDTVAEKKATLKKAEEDGRTFGMISDEWLNFWKNDKDDKTIKSRCCRHELMFCRISITSLRGGVMNSTIHRHDISDHVWSILEPLLPGRKGS